VIDFPDLATFAAVVADRRFVAAMAIAILSGLLRGFSGFGSALVYVPLVAAVYEPVTASATLLLINFVTGAPFAVPAFPHCNWREVLPIWIAAAIAAPMGAKALVMLDPVLLRWFIAATVLALLFVLMSGWRYHGKPKLPITLGVGLLSGFGGGVAQISGPPVIIYWLGGALPALTARANLIVYFLLSGAVICVVYGAQGLFTADVAVLALLLGVPFLVAQTVGARLFHRASEQIYRYVAYAIVAAAALLSLPVLDGLLR
jgi:uncharacterized membrane protein YfcA